MKSILILLISLLLFRCNKKQSEEVIKEEQKELIEPTKPEETELYEPVPPSVSPKGQNGVPSDAMVLFDGSNLDEWEMAYGNDEVTWILNDDDKSMTVHRTDGVKNATIQTKKVFGSVQLHMEWKSPEEIKGDGQHRGNSGVFLQGTYEVQILDNNDNDTYVNGQVGAIYKQSVPLAKASVPTGEWNTYDIIYHAPEFNELGEKTKSATITVLHNGVLIQDHFEIKGSTEYIGWPNNSAHGKAPIKLQDHGDAVSYRNIWVRELD
ncbi:MAG: DUF1080 domain-containing protein [Algibacter sp.]|uniref:3-keto-disaccharide hydrolase n=1 Tax=Algibacter sp. TaxID=1872428 RepID=UPI00261CBE6D|nr:DUF1080 domain-containing protein [Algibacter sp.]MDG1728419.1 DUF1080 domain-containing protein [Algibacter sp.]MDG2178105.1 DUF1080 domain-containing protein [Algibacter sp.]